MYELLKFVKFTRPEVTCDYVDFPPPPKKNL